MIAPITGRFYGDLLREWIFTPLEMTTARVISEEDIIPNRAAGYRLDGGLLRNQEYVIAALNRTADGVSTSPFSTSPNGIASSAPELCYRKPAAKPCGPQ